MNPQEELADVHATLSMHTNCATDGRNWRLMWQRLCEQRQEAIRSAYDAGMRKAGAAMRIMNEADNKRAAAERECASLVDRLSGAELERDALGAKLEAAREQFVVLAADALNARQVIHGFMAYVKCGQIPEDAHCVKRAKQLLNTSIATEHIQDWIEGAKDEAE